MDLVLFAVVTSVDSECCVVKVLLVIAGIIRNFGWGALDKYPSQALLPISLLSPLPIPASPLRPSLPLYDLPFLPSLLHCKKR